MMFRWLLPAALFLSLAGVAAAQDTSTSNSNDSTAPETSTSKPAGTKVVGHDRGAIVTPAAKPVKVDSKVIKAAQAELQNRGYNPGPPDGVAGTQTRSAISKFQADQGLRQTGHLDADTLTKLNVGGTHILSSAPSDLARGGKAAGHNIKEAHPVDAGKAAAKGSESFGKKVAKGSKSLAVRGVQKVGRGLSAIGDKVEDKTQGDDNQQPEPSPPPMR